MSVEGNAKAVDISPKQDGGVLKEIIKPGEGDDTPSNGCTVKVHYTGTFLDGSKFDSSKDRGPFPFTLGQGTVIKAWDIGVATMKKGEICKLTCSPEYAYGADGSPGSIPPNSTLIFEIEMLSWKLEDLSTKEDGGILRQIIEPGEATSTPNWGSTVEITLKGEYNGTVFDDRTVSFPIGEGSEFNVCKGVEKALLKFKRKEKSRLEIKSKYGFGPEGNSTFNVPPDVDLVYTVRLNSFEELKSSWALTDEEKIQQAKVFKEKGTKYFSCGNHRLALKMYKKMVDYVDNEFGFSEELEKERKALFLAGHLNCALCYLKVNLLTEAKDECNEVLKKEPENVKALYRRGQAYLELAEPEIAKKDFEAVLKLESTNKAAAACLAQCNQKLKQQKAKEKQIYSNMFEKFAKKDQEKEEEERKKQPDVMKTLGEWGAEEREREPTDFEKENPNILMLDGTGDFKNM